LLNQIDSKLKIKITLYVNYFVFAILLNSVGIVILKSQNIFGVDEVQASILELFKDLPIAIVSFFTASLLPKIGYKKSMMAGLALVFFACIGMYFGNSFWAAKILFLCVGAAFALIKVSVYSTIGLVTDNQTEHNSLMNSIEGVFMIGITCGYFLFPYFNTSEDPNAWLQVYLLLALLVILAMGFLASSNFDIDEIKELNKSSYSLLEMFYLLRYALVIVFILSAFLFVLVEQGIMTWLPSFNERVLSLPENLAIMMTSLLFISSAIGRLGSALLVKKVKWIWIVITCLAISMIIVVFILPKVIQTPIGEVNSLFDIPIQGYLFPVIGLFLAPIYPLINSVVLSALPTHQHSTMSGLIIVFSALGGTLGSRIIGYLFKYAGADNAFGYLMIPLIMLMVTAILLFKYSNSNQVG